MSSGQIEDAEVVSEGPKPPPPPPRAAKLEPAPAEAFSVFDGPVKDAPNATGKPDEARKKARQAAKAKRGGAKGGARSPAAAASPAGPPGVDPEVVKRLQAEAAARRVLELYEGWQLGQVRSRYGEILEPHSLNEIVNALKYKPEVLAALSKDLGEGFAENDVEFPWWARFGSMFIADLMAKRQMLERVELAYQSHQKQQRNAAAPPAPAQAA